MKSVAIVTAVWENEQQKEILFSNISEAPLLYHAIEPFEKSRAIDEIILLYNKGDKQRIKDMVDECQLEKVSKLLIGCKTKVASYKKGFKAIDYAGEKSVVTIHSPLRPLVRTRDLPQLIKGAKKYGAIVSAYSQKPIKHFEYTYYNGNIDEKIVTPQSYNYELLEQVFQKPLKKYDTVLDLVHGLGHQIKVVRGNPKNNKIDKNSFRSLEKALKQ